MASIKFNITPYAIESEAVLTTLQSDAANGLTSAESQERLKNGANKIGAKKDKSIWLIFLSQFKSPIVWLLVFAAGLPFYFGELLDSIAILIVILINALIGFYMEYHAERSMNALKKLSAVPTKVQHNEKLEELNAEEIVPGEVEVNKWIERKKKVWVTLEDVKMIVIDWFEMDLISMKHNDSTYTYPKDSVYGNKYCDGSIIRVYNNLEYPLINPNETIMIY